MIRQLGLLLTGTVFLATGMGGQSPKIPTVRIPNSCRANPPITDGNDVYQQILLGADPTAIQEVVSRWLRHPDLAAQALAVRTLGWWERPELASTLAPMLSSPSPQVRSEAANALGQSVQGASANDRPRVMGEAAILLAARLPQEEDATVRGVICETLGRLIYPDAAGVQAIEKILIDATWAGAGAENRIRSDAPIAARLGAVKGLETLLRQHVKLFTPAEATITRLRELALGRARGQPVAEDDAVTRIRRISLLALAPHAKADEPTLARALEDGQWEVRRIAVRLAGAGLRTAAPTTQDARLALIRRGLADPDWHVRYEAVSAFARNQDAPDCAPILRALRDRSTHVALLAIDELRRCRAATAPDVTRALQTLCRSLPVPTANAVGKTTAPPSWHRAAHAIVAMAYAAPDVARSELGRFKSSTIWQVRMYAARAAAVLKDGSILRELAGDPDDNVRNAAISGLSQVEQHSADEVFISQLVRSDGQLLMAAARALRGSKNAAALPALLAALNAQTKLIRSNSRDARLALLERIGELGYAEHAAALQPLLEDFDPRVAATAAGIVTRWTGIPSTTPDVQPIRYAISIATMRRLEGATAVVRMKNGRSFTLDLLTWEAPETVVGFTNLVECGYYNGLTFHRVEPNFVIQGGSSGANEYAGYPYFMLDEVGLSSNRRGTVGLSTRGRNTGDAQWYVNLVDNARLDHNYTVFATVVSGMDVVDAILEGDEIAEIRLVTRMP
jgi:cyclophilin family peptidyl-prolyl cis-trans isomerase/HEAT repeat protein